MANLTIDGKDYDIDSLNETSKQALASLQYTQSELKRAQAHIAVLKIAEAAYVNLLKKDIEEPEA
mgnify:CR=1 FL=1